MIKTVTAVASPSACVWRGKSMGGEFVDLNNREKSPSRLTQIVTILSKSLSSFFLTSRTSTCKHLFSEAKVSIPALRTASVAAPVCTCSYGPGNRLRCEDLRITLSKP